MLKKPLLALFPRLFALFLLAPGLPGPSTARAAADKTSDSFPKLQLAENFCRMDLEHSALDSLVPLIHLSPFCNEDLATRLDPLLQQQADRLDAPALKDLQQAVRQAGEGDSRALENLLRDMARRSEQDSPARAAALWRDAGALALIRGAESAKEDLAEALRLAPDDAESEILAALLISVFRPEFEGVLTGHERLMATLREAWGQVIARARQDGDARREALADLNLMSLALLEIMRGAAWHNFRSLDDEAPEDFAARLREIDPDAASMLAVNHVLLELRHPAHTAMVSGYPSFLEQLAGKLRTVADLFPGNAGDLQRARLLKTLLVLTLQSSHKISSHAVRIMPASVIDPASLKIKQQPLLDLLMAEQEPARDPLLQARRLWQKRLYGIATVNVKEGRSDSEDDAMLADLFQSIKLHLAAGQEKDAVDMTIIALEVATRLNRFEEADSFLTVLMQYWKDRNDRKQMVHVIRWRMALAMRLGKPDRADEVGTAFFSEMQASGDYEAAFGVKETLAELHWMSGGKDRARQLVDEAVTLALENEAQGDVVSLLCRYSLWAKWGELEDEETAAYDRLLEIGPLTESRKSENGKNDFELRPCMLRLDAYRKRIERHRVLETMRSMIISELLEARDAGNAETVFNYLSGLAFYEEWFGNYSRASELLDRAMSVTRDAGREKDEIQLAFRQARVLEQSFDRKTAPEDVLAEIDKGYQHFADLLDRYSRKPGRRMKIRLEYPIEVMRFYQQRWQSWRTTAGTPSE